MDNDDLADNAALKGVTARTLGVYVFMTLKGSPTSSGDLAKAFGGDRKTYLKDLQALMRAGLVRKTIQVVNGRPITTMSLTDESPFNGLQLLLSQQNSNLLLNAYSLISKKEYIRERMGDEKMSDYEPSPMYLEPEERAEYARRRRLQQQAEFRAVKEQKTTERIQAKKNRKPEEWSSDDAAYHFAERVELSWHIKPWLTARTRFKAAFGQARKMYGTTGDIEIKMMDRFFDALEHEKSVDDPEIVWKMFIKQFPTLLADVNRTTVTDEDVKVAQEWADKQWGELDV